MQTLNARSSSFLLLALLVVAAGCGGDDTAASESGDPYADTMAAMHADDRPVASGVSTEMEMEVDTQWVRLGMVGGDSVRAYLAHPASTSAEGTAADTTAAWPGLVVVHEWWGLNQNIRQMTQRLASLGYRALAVDLYGGEVADQPEGARTLMQEARQDEAQIQEVIGEAIAYLEEGGDTQVGVLGWCFGGSVAMQAVRAHPDVLDAAVIYYGQPIVDEEMLASANVPIIGHFGADDQSIPVDSVRAFQEALQGTDLASEVHIYEDAGHAFANPSGQNYVEGAAERAWERTQSFLATHLRNAPDDQMN